MTDDVAQMYCVNHPNVPTSLRCNNCERPICAKCAVLTPTGYRCKDCIRDRQRVFETARWLDYPIAILVAAVLSFLGSLIASRLGFLIIFVAPIAGVIIAEVVRFFIRKRRSRLLTQLTTAATALGSTAQLLILLVTFSFYNILTLVFLGIYAFTVTSTVLYRLGGIQIK
jgi:hypothetical protein